MTITGLDYLRILLRPADNLELDRVLAGGVTITDGMQIDPYNTTVTVHTLLSHLFIWQNTPQGHQFWHKMAERYEAPFQPGDYVEALVGFPGMFTKGGVYVVTVVWPHAANTWLVYVQADNTGQPTNWLASNFKLHKIGDAYTNIGATHAAIGSFRTVETPEEVRKSRADAIWEALHSVAKPN